MSEHEIQWYTAAPLWGDLIETALPSGSGASVEAEVNAARGDFQRPAILRFASDTFMEDFLSMLENAPSRMGELRAVRETWRGPSGEPAPVVKLPRFVRPLELRRQAAAQPANGFKALLARAAAPVEEDVFGPVNPALKLYQPAHMRHYLVSASLVCQTPGLPDRQLNTSAQERVSFVLRRLIPTSANDNVAASPYPADEFALVKEDGKTGWKQVSSGRAVLQSEERLPLFPVSFQQVEGRRRRLFAGVIPVGRREAYMGAGRLASSDAQTGGAANPQPTLKKPGELLFLTQVIEPWKRLVETASAVGARVTAPVEPGVPTDAAAKADANARDVKSAREQIQSASWLILLDFARLLKQFLPNVWDHISQPEPAQTLSPNEQRLLDKIKGTSISYRVQLVVAGNYPLNKVLTTLDQALAAISGGKPADAAIAKDIAEGLESAVGEYDRENPSAFWPGFLFPLADPRNHGPLPQLLPDEVLLETGNLKRDREQIELLRKSLQAALPQAATRQVPPLPLADQQPLDSQLGWFVLRCVMERPECDPSLSPAVVSEASQPFQMAGFFDPDAPARPIRISLPVDTTPAGLRKFDKNTAFMISDVLCGQIERAKGMSLGDLIRSVLPWPLHKSLSVPDTGPCTSESNTIGMICSLSIPIITICALILLMIIVSLLDLIFRWLPYFMMCFPLFNLRAKERA